MSKFWLLLLITHATSIFAHEVRPGFLELRQTTPTTFDVTWKVPGKGQDMRLSLDVVFPKGTEVVNPKRSSFRNHAFLQYWSVKHPTAFAGETIAISGLTGTMTDVILRVERLSGGAQISRLTPQSPSATVQSAPSRIEVAKTYYILGIEHILLGFDHLLFVLALILLVNSTSMLLKTVTAFTIAHSLTLALTVLDQVHLPQVPVEAAIALSILLLAVELAAISSPKSRVRAGLTKQWPWLVAFVFGLLHGFGFASALSEIGIPHEEVPTALVMFNVGVESGQLLFIGVVLAIKFLASQVGFTNRMQKLSRVAMTYGIGSAAVFWLLERLARF